MSASFRVVTARLHHRFGGSHCLPREGPLGSASLHLTATSLPLHIKLVITVDVTFVPASVE